MSLVRQVSRIINLNLQALHYIGGRNKPSWRARKARLYIPSQWWHTCPSELQEHCHSDKDILGCSCCSMTGLIFLKYPIYLTVELLFIQCQKAKSFLLRHSEVVRHMQGQTCISKKACFGLCVVMESEQAKHTMWWLTFSCACTSFCHRQCIFSSGVRTAVHRATAISLSCSSSGNQAIHCIHSGVVPLLILPATATYSNTPWQICATDSCEGVKVC